jgi:D-alanyl-lipoteichoic acid acyltransferase DltB (MBOAT superfamily)
MWLLSIAIFLGCKWQTWFAARPMRMHASIFRNLAYLLLWPGMDASSFLVGTPVGKPGTREWFTAAAQTIAGAALIVCAWKTLSSVPGLLAGWIAMLGLVLFLHFGSFHVWALLWQRAGVDAEPIMRSPMKSVSLAEFWGRRWNIGFRQLSHDLVFEPCRQRIGLGPAILAAFLVSGLIHDLVISFPARGGYGLPTVYFLLQGFGVLLERSAVGRRLGLGAGARGWVYVVLVAGAPAIFLFHPIFVRRVIIPFIAAIGSVLFAH